MSPFVSFPLGNSLLVDGLFTLSFSSGCFNILLLPFNLFLFPPPCFCYCDGSLLLTCSGCLCIIALTALVDGLNLPAPLLLPPLPLPPMLKDDVMVLLIHKGNACVASMKEGHNDYNNIQRKMVCTANEYEKPLYRYDERVS